MSKVIKLSGTFRSKETPPATFVETRQLWIADEVKRLREIVKTEGGSALVHPTDTDLALIQTSVTNIQKWRAECYGHNIGVLDGKENTKEEVARLNSAEHQMAKQLRTHSQKRGRR